MAGSTGDAAARVGARTAHIEPADRCSVVCMAGHRPRREELAELELSVKNVAADETEGTLEIERTEDLSRDHRFFEVRCIAVDGVDHQVGNLFAFVVPGSAVGKLRR